MRELIRQSKQERERVRETDQKSEKNVRGRQEERQSETVSE